MMEAEFDYLLSRCAAAAYGSRASIKKRCAGDLQLVNPWVFNAGSVQGFIANRGDDVIVSFAGTDPRSLIDLIRDSEIGLTECDYGPGRVHGGFDLCVAMVWRALHERIVRREPSRIICTGHSKGAAEATLLAARLCHFSTMHPILVTFGSPRVGDARFAKWLRTQLQASRRYVRTCDAIARMPLFGFRVEWGLPLTIELQTCYRHIGPAHYLDVNGRLFVDPPRLFIAADRVRARWRHIGKLGTAGLDAHLLNESYQSALKELAR